MTNAALQSTQNTSNAVAWVVPTSTGGLKVVRWDTEWAKALGGDPVPLFAAQLTKTTADAVPVRKNDSGSKKTMPSNGPVCNLNTPWLECD